MNPFNKPKAKAKVPEPKPPAPIVYVVINCPAHTITEEEAARRRAARLPVPACRVSVPADQVKDGKLIMPGADFCRSHDDLVVRE